MTTFVDIPAAGDETTTLLAALDRNRRTFAWKTADLDDDAMRRTVGASSLTLGSLVKHLAFVEDFYFTTRLHGRDLPSPWLGIDWDTEPDWPWTSASQDSAADLTALWTAAVVRSRAAVDDALADGGLDRLTRWSPSGGALPSLRRVVVDLVEEYARHTGHADLIRESIDGRVGEDPPAEFPVVG